jgi:putative DNA methylase
LKVKKKLIEVAMPLEAMNAGCEKEKNPFLKGLPRSLHLWWARRPLAAARAVIFAQMVDDPSSHPELFPTEEEQQKERQRLMDLIGKIVLEKDPRTGETKERVDGLVAWENTNNEELLQQAREEIWKSWRRTCEENKDHPQAVDLFNPEKLPAFHDPFAGGGSLPLEAQRLGLEAYASDLNPVAVLINKAMIEIPPKFAGKPPVKPEARKGKNLFQKEWKGARGLAEDVRYYGHWMRDEAEKRIGHLYPKVEVTEEMARVRPDLKKYVGRKLTVIAWIWARTVKSPNPAYADVDVPLASTFMLSTKKGKEAYVVPVIEDGNSYRFEVKVGKPNDIESARRGTTAGKRKAFRCLMSDVPITYKHIRENGKSGQMGAKLMAVVAEGERERLYLTPSQEQEDIAAKVKPEWVPDMKLPENPRDFKTPNYGLNTFGDLFTPRQLVALTTFSDLVAEAREKIYSDAKEAGFPSDDKSLKDGGTGALAYAEAVSAYLACGVSHLSRYLCSICTWNKTNQNIAQAFGRQAIPMVWDFAEGNPIEGNLNFTVCVGWTAGFLKNCNPTNNSFAIPADATTQVISLNKVVSTDPPYFDNIGYADLSDFFYIWLRKPLKKVFPKIFATLAVPKSEELVATPYRHENEANARQFFLNGMTEASKRIAFQAHPAFPATVYYAFKQSEAIEDEQKISTGWEIFLDSIVRSGFSIKGTWPVRTERSEGLKTGKNTLASSIVLVCRRRSQIASIATRREFLEVLKGEMPGSLRNLQKCGIAPVDLAQASIGPGMAVFTRYSKVLESDGTAMSVRTALTLINQILDEVLAEQEGEFDADTRWALAWFEQFGMSEGPFGEADVLSRAKNTSVNGLEQAGIVKARGGKVRLLSRKELSQEWDPVSDKRLTVWEVTQHLIRTLEEKGEIGVAEIVSKLGGIGETAKDLAYRLFTLCERKGWAKEALAYNSLAVAWPEISRLAFSTTRDEKPQQGNLF